MSQNRKHPKFELLYSPVINPKFRKNLAPFCEAMVAHDCHFGYASINYLLGEYNSCKIYLYCKLTLGRHLLFRVLVIPVTKPSYFNINDTNLGLNSY